MAETAAQRGRFKRIARGRAGSVRLHEREPIGVDCGARIDALKQYFLRFGGGQRNSVGAPVGVDVGGENQAAHRIAAAMRMSRFAQHENGTAFCADEAIGACGERLAQTCRRKHRGLRERDE